MDLNTSQNTPPSDAEAESLLRQMIDEQIKKSGPATSTEPEPLKMNIGGQEMSFKDLNEAAAHFNNSFGQFQQKINELQSQPQHKVVTSDDDTGDKFDQKRFVDLMVENPLAAFDYADEFRYGMKEPTKAIKQTMQAIPQLAQEAIVRNWADRHPEWEYSDENSAIMERTIRDLGVPISPQGLEAAYQVARSKGHLKFGDEQGNVAPQNQPQQNSAPPVAARSGSTNTSSSSDLLAKLENMPMSDLEDYFARLNSR